MISENRPFFSVVIPLYNKQNYIKETIKSVLNQTFQDLEIVIVNDGSKDDSVKVVESIQDDRIKLLHQKNSGVSVATISKSISSAPILADSKADTQACSIRSAVL